VSLLSAPTTKRTHPKRSYPPDFSGEHHNSYAFLNSYSLYIRLAPEQFYDKQEKILWALTFFKSGRATKWSENMFCQETNTSVERVQKGIAHWNKQNNDVPAPNCVLKVQGEIIKVEGL